MSKTYTHKDKYGSYKLRIDDDIVYLELDGMFGEYLTEKYTSTVITHIDGQLSSRSWGLYANLTNCDGFTLEAENLFKAQYKRSLNRGCVVDAYQINSAMLIAQLDNIRSSNGVKNDIKDVIFDSEEKCINSIKQTLQAEPHKL